MRSMVFNIPIENMAQLNKKLKSLNKKACRAGTSQFKLTVVSETAEKQDNGYVNVYKQVVVEGEQPRICGWTFVARLDHNCDHTGGSNLVYVMPGQTLPQEYRTRSADCEHCGWIRKRRDTYILCNDQTGELKQVGRTCIQDFIGIDPEKVLAHTEWLKSLYDTARDAESEPLDRSNIRDNRFVDVQTFLSYVACAIKHYGWISSKQAYSNDQMSTRDYAWKMMFPCGLGVGYGSKDPQLNSADSQVAESAIAWALQQDKTSSDFVYNMVTIAETGYMDYKATATAAWIVQGYLKHLGDQQDAIDLSKSQHFANPGDKIRGKVQVISKKILPMSQYDQFAKTLVRMLSQDGNLIVTFATGSFGSSVEAGDQITIRATVTKNDVFNGVNQTVVNRVRIIQ